MAEQATLRAATPADAVALAEVFAAAARAGWAEFLGADVLAAVEPPVEGWRQRVEAARAGAGAVVVAERDGAVVGFASLRPAGDDLPPGTGEVAALYTHPAAWGQGVGRLLLGHALDRLRAGGCGQAVLWTEVRNDRPRRVYERAGWVADGATRQRAFLDLPIFEVRYRLPLA